MRIAATTTGAFLATLFVANLVIQTILGPMVFQTFDLGRESLDTWNTGRQVAAFALAVVVALVVYGRGNKTEEP